MSESSPQPPVPQHPIAPGATRSLRRPARFAVGALAIVAAVAAQGSIWDNLTYRMLSGPGFSPSGVDQLRWVGQGLSALYLLTSVFAGISFIIWLHRARTNLDRWDVRGLIWARAWAIRGWFLPFANIVIPLVVVSETDRASENLAAAVEGRPVGRVGRTIFVLWVVFWNLSGVTSLAAAFGGDQARTGTYRELADHRGLYLALSYGNALVVIVAAALAIQLVRGVTANQEIVRRAMVAARPLP